jgi:hypothetical protein
LLPSGYVLLAKPAFLRSIFYRHYDNSAFYFKLIKRPDLSNSPSNNTFSFGIEK